MLIMYSTLLCMSRKISNIVLLKIGNVVYALSRRHCNIYGTTALYVRNLSQKVRPPRLSIRSSYSLLTMSPYLSAFLTVATEYFTSNLYWTNIKYHVHIYLTIYYKGFRFARPLDNEKNDDFFFKKKFIFH